MNGNRLHRLHAAALLAAAFSWTGARAAGVTVWVEDASGRRLRDAVIVVLRGADTAATALSRTGSAVSFSLDAEGAGLRARAVPGPAGPGQVLVFPNPCGATVTLEGGRPGPGGSVALYNVLGQEVFSSPAAAPRDVEAAMDMRLDGLPAGLYLALVRDGRGGTRAGKLLKTGSPSGTGGPAVLLKAVRPRAAAPEDGCAALCKPGSAAYRFTAFSTRKAQDAEGRHAAGIATQTVDVAGDTAVTLRLDPVPFNESGHTLAHRALAPVNLDGRADEPCWAGAAWGPIPHLWLGEAPEPADFSGRYKVMWRPDRIYVLVEFRDDSLSDQIEDPFKDYYKDDCVELFLDEDASGGDHKLNYSAFAYHTALDGFAADLGPNWAVKDFSEHVASKWTRAGDVVVWEFGVKAYPDTYDDRRTDNAAATLAGGKIMGFMVAYCDNDGTHDRESFVGSIFIPGADKNRGWVDAGVFGTLELLP